MNSAAGIPSRADENASLFLSEHVPGYTGVVPLEGDASARSYYRVFTGSGTYVLCCDSALIDNREADYSFLRVYNLLKETVPIPRILAIDGKKGLLLMQDLGDDLLEYAFPLLTKDKIISIYEYCLENLFLIQCVRGEGSAPFSMSFDVEKLMFEFNFFIEHALLGYFKASGHSAELQCLKSEFLTIAGLLVRPELFVLNHRDYHSRNIIIYTDVPYIIDFQDARMGLPQYDAVSLLRDSYIQLDPVLFTYLKNFYYEGGLERGIHSMGKDEFDYYFDIMAFQRNIKAIGTFGYQAGRGNRRFEKYIGPTVAYLADYAERQDELKKAWGILCRHIGGCAGRQNQL